MSSVSLSERIVSLKARMEEAERNLRLLAEAADRAQQDIESCPGETPAEQNQLQQLGQHLKGMALQIGWWREARDRAFRQLFEAEGMLARQQRQEQLRTEAAEAYTATIAALNGNGKAAVHDHRKNPKQVGRSVADYRLRSAFDRPGERIDKPGSGRRRGHGHQRVA
ncbi:MAG: hypothetical protein HYY50_03045 [Candidatus Kerfeldbacteria bacterium]|nr:hypothetical protein [Candidatus Kerfeldbacteria bacterium]